MSTRVHADARVGHHVAGGLAGEGPTGKWALATCRHFRRPILSRRRRSRGPESTRSSIRHLREKRT